MAETDRELLELAAKSAGLPPVGMEGGEGGTMSKGGLVWSGEGDCIDWNPLTDDGDALRLAVKLRLIVRVDEYGATARSHEERPAGPWSGCEAHLHGGIEAATRRAIVRAAAAIGKGAKP